MEYFQEAGAGSDEPDTALGRAARFFLFFFSKIRNTEPFQKRVQASLSSCSQGKKKKVKSETKGEFKSNETFSLCFETT